MLTSMLPWWTPMRVPDGTTCCAFWILCMWAWLPGDKVQRDINPLAGASGWGRRHTRLMPIRRAPGEKRANKLPAAPGENILGGANMGARSTLAAH